MSSFQRMVTNCSLYNPPPTPGRSPTIPSTQHPQDGHPQSQGYSPNFPRLVIHQILDGQLSSLEESSTITRTVIHLSLDASSASTGRDSNQTSVGWSVTIPMMVIHYPQGDPPSQDQSSTIPRMVMVTINPQDSNHYPQDCHLVSPQWSTNIQMMVAH